MKTYVRHTEYLYWSTRYVLRAPSTYERTLIVVQYDVVSLAHSKTPASI